MSLDNVLAATLAEIKRQEHDIERLRTIERPGYLLPFSPYDSLSPFTGSPVVTYNVTLDRDGTIAKWTQVVRVLTTNDGTNYWTLNLSRIDTDAVLMTFNTSAIAAGIWTKLSNSTITAITASMSGLYILATKTGAPGVLLMASPWVYAM